MSLAHALTCLSQSSGIVVQTQRSLHIDLEHQPGNSYDVELGEINEKREHAQHDI